MDLKTFYKLNRKKSIEEKLELIYDTAQIMSHNAYCAGADQVNHNKDGYEYYSNERHAMEERLRWLCRSIMDEVKGDEDGTSSDKR